MALEIVHRPSALRSLSHYHRGREVVVSAGELTMRVEMRILNTYLPALADYSISRYDTVNLNRIAFQNPYYNKQSWFRDTMLDTLDTLVRSLARNIDRSEATNLELTSFLEESLRDLYSGRLPHHQHALTYQRFLCLAHIAEYAGSERIKSLLSHFFIKYGGRLVRNEEATAVFDWCKVVAYYLSTSDRVGCLRELVMNRESIVHDLRLVHHYKPSTQTRGLLHIVEDMLARMSNQDDFYDGLELRGRSRRRETWRPRETVYRQVRHYSTSPPRRRLPLPPPYGSSAVVPYSVRSLTSRALSQNDHQKITRLEARMHEAEEAVTWVARKQLDQDDLKISARRISGDSDDDRYLLE